MKIVCVIGSIGVGGGAERVMSHLCNYLADRHEMVYIATDEYKGDIYYLRDNVKLYNGLKYNNQLHALWVLRKTILKEKPDIIISFLTFINLAVLLATAFTRIPVIVSERGNLKTRKKWREYLRLILYPFAKGIVFQTNDARNHFKGKIFNNSVVIHNPVFVDPQLIDSKSTIKKKEISTIGRFEYQKNHEMTIKAFANISQKFPEYKLMIYGGGVLEEKLHQLIDSLDLKNRVILCGRIPDVHERIKESTLFVMSSRWEGMPNSLMEAMALGLPCISTDCPVGGPKELIQDGVNGYLIPVEDQKALEVKISEALLDLDKIAIIGNNARKILETHSINIICGQWENYILSKVNK